jgi:hypothetical protein
VIAAAALSLAAAPTATAERAVALRYYTTLVEFDTATPDFYVEHPITGVGAGEQLQSIAYRPSDGRVYGVSAQGGNIHRLYTLDPNTGAATLVGPAAGADFTAVEATDFDPVADVLRVTDAFFGVLPENGRIDPATGARLDVPNDTDLSARFIEGIAYAPGSAPGLTTLYAIKSDPSPTFGTIGAADSTPSSPTGPNGGVYTPLGPLGAASDNRAPFDISAQTGIGYAVLVNNTNIGFYRINPAAAPGPVATLIGHAGFAHDFVVRGLAILPGDGPKPPPPPPTCGRSSATITGTDASETIKGTKGSDVIAGLGGNDKIIAGNGNDTVCGGDGNDKINGGAGIDRLSGGAGKDKLNGSGGKPDVCYGDAGKDKSSGSCEKVRSA